MVTKEEVIKRISDLQGECAARDREIAKLNQEIADHVNQINARMGAIKELSEWLPKFDG